MNTTTGNEEDGYDDEEEEEEEKDWALDQFDVEVPVLYKWNKTKTKLEKNVKTLLVSIGIRWSFTYNIACRLVPNFIITLVVKIFSYSKNLKN